MLARLALEVMTQYYAVQFDTCTLTGLAVDASCYFSYIKYFHNNILTHLRYMLRFWMSLLYFHGQNVYQLHANWLNFSFYFCSNNSEESCGVYIVAKQQISDSFYHLCGEYNVWKSGKKILECSVLGSLS